MKRKQKVDEERWLRVSMLTDETVSRNLGDQLGQMLLIGHIK